MKYVPKRPIEANIPAEHPLREPAWLFAGVLGLLVIAWILSLFAAAIAASSISLTRERELGLKFSPRPDPDAKTDPRLPRLQALVKRIAPSTLDPTLLPSVGIIESKDANAFAFPGGHISFTEGLLNEAQSENELAFVAAHELAHYLNRDPLKAMGRSLVLFSLATLLGLDSAESSASVIFGSSNLALHQGYSRHVEEEADLHAALLTASHYGHLQSSLDFFRRNEHKAQGPAWLSSHPAASDRIARLEAWAGERGIALSGTTKALPKGWNAAGAAP